MTSLLADRYSSDAMRSIWSLEQKYLLERELWILVMKAQASAGFDISSTAIEDYEKVKSNINIQSIATREALLKHDVKARIEEFNALAGHQLIHLGLTSRDVTDNIELLQIRNSLDLIFGKSEILLLRLADLAEKFADITMVGRTHNVPAQVTTLGKRFATWGEELLFSTRHLKELIERLPLRGIKGAIGTSLDQIELLGNSGRELDRDLLELWNFDSALISPSQIYPRSIDFEVVSTLSQIAAAPSTIATNIRLMSGFGLLSEGFAQGQVGSSAMPHKVNPRLSERVNSLEAILKGFVTMAAQISGGQWNEGDVSCSAVRRVVLPDSFHALDGIIDTSISILNNLEVHETKIKSELKEHVPLMLSTKILMLSVKAGVGRERAHELIKKYARNSSKGSFIDDISLDPELKVGKTDLEKLMENPNALAGDASKQAREVSLLIRGNVKNGDSRDYAPQIRN